MENVVYLCHVETSTLPLAIIQFFPGTTIVSTHNLGYLGVSEKTGVVARSNFLL
jgi:hypothetical protein